MINYDELFMAQQGFSRAAVAPVPSSWTQFKVQVQVTPDGFQVAIDGPSLIGADDGLYGPAKEILRIHSDAGHTLAGFTYDFTRKPDGGWKGVADFAYA